MGWLAWLRAQANGGGNGEGDGGGVADGGANAGGSANAGGAGGAASRAGVPGSDGNLVPPRISGPYTSGNLSLFLIHGPDKAELREFITLEEAMANNRVEVKETGNVGSLAIKNLGDVAVFIQSGDIVMGGKQDRALQYDMILTPKSGFVPINSFCVERGRWQQRQGESVDKFHSSGHHMSSKDLKMAAKYHNNQNEVWNQVARLQMNSASNLAMSLGSVSGPSPSSLPQTMENENVKKVIDKYVGDLANAPEGQSDVIGYAFAINGKVNSADVYACNALFKKMYSKLLKAAATEALAADDKKPHATPTVEQVAYCMDDADGAEAKTQAVTHKTRNILRESPHNVLFEAQDMEKNDAWVHRNYVTK